MLEVEFELSVNVGIINVRSQAALLRHLLVKPRPRNRLVVFESDDHQAPHPCAGFAQLLRQRREIVLLIPDLLRNYYLQRNRH
jgi:hypothetical protein